MAYVALVRPQLEYCSTVWAPHQQYQIHALEMVEHHATRFVEHLYGQQSVTAMLHRLHWDELLQRRLKAQVTMCYKINNSLVSIPTTQLAVGAWQGVDTCN